MRLRCVSHVILAVIFFYFCPDSGSSERGGGDFGIETPEGEYTGGGIEILTKVRSPCSTVFEKQLHGQLCF